MNEKYRKRKRYFSSNLMAKKNKDLFLKTGIKGFICTCNGNEKQCIRESYNILNEYTDQLFGEEKVTKPPNEEVESKADEDDELDEFKKEVDSLKVQHEQNVRRFQAVDTGVTNCIFIKTNLEDPVSLIYTIMKDLAEKKQLKARFLSRMVPIEITCKALLDEITNCAAPLFDLHFKAEPLTYAIALSKRCNSSLDRDKTIEKLAAMVQERNAEHKVNLSTPTVTIIVEAMKGICGLAVVRDYFQMSKYNLRQLCGLPLNDREYPPTVESSSEPSNFANDNQPNDDAERGSESSVPDSTSNQDVVQSDGEKE